MHTFTNTITTLYDYYVKLVIYSDNGLTSSTTETNGGYIKSLSPVAEEIDPFTGEYKPGGLSITMRNIDDEVSDNIFGGTVSDMEARLWVSYDSGTTYECIFYGAVEWWGLKRTDLDATETHNREYSFSARHSILSLKEVGIDTDPDDPGGNVPTTGLTTPSVTMKSRATDAAGNPISGSTDYDDYVYISLDGILQYIFSNVQFISGSTAPTLAYDSTAMQHVGQSLTGAGVNFTFDELHLLFQSPTVLGVESFFNYRAGKYGAYALSNLQEMLRLFMDSLIMVPVTRLTESAGSFTLNVYFEPRFRAASDLTALTGTVTPVLTREMNVQEWLEGVQVLTTGLPAEPSITYSTYSYGGRTFELKNHLMTGPYFNDEPYVFLYTHIIPDPSSGLDTSRHDGPSAQMLYGLAGGAVNTIHLFKHLTSQSFYGDAVTGGYYGVHGSAFNLLNANLDPRSRSSIYGQKGYDITVKTLATDNAGTKSIWDLRLLKKMTIDGTTCQIIGITRDVMKNETKIRAIEVT